MTKLRSKTPKNLPQQPKMISQIDTLCPLINTPCVGEKCFPFAEKVMGGGIACRLTLGVGSLQWISAGLETLNQHMAAMNESLEIIADNLIPEDEEYDEEYEEEEEEDELPEEEEEDEEEKTGEYRLTQKKPEPQPEPQPEEPEPEYTTEEFDTKGSLDMRQFLGAQDVVQELEKTLVSQPDTPKAQDGGTKEGDQGKDDK